MHFVTLLMGPETGAEVPACPQCIHLFIQWVGRAGAQRFSLEPGLMNRPAPHSVTILLSMASVLY